LRTKIRTIIIIIILYRRRTTVDDAGTCDTRPSAGRLLIIITLCVVTEFEGAFNYFHTKRVQKVKNIFLFSLLLLLL